MTFYGQKYGFSEQKTVQKHFVVAITLKVKKSTGTPCQS